MVTGQLSLSCNSNESEIAINKELDDCLGVSVPFPVSATVTACTDAVVGKSAGFRYAVPWKEAVDFFSEKYNTDGWELTVDNIRDDEPGSSRNVTWTAVKNDTKVSINLHDFRVDESSGSINGVILRFYEKE